MRGKTKRGRIPDRIRSKAEEILKKYTSGEMRARKSRCGRLIIEVGHKWRWLSKDDGKSWQLMSHEKYNNEINRQ